MKIYVVGVSSKNGSKIEHFCRTRQLAIKRLAEKRDRLLEKYERAIKYCDDEEKQGYLRVINLLLKENDYRNYGNWNDNFLHNVPFIEEIELEEANNEN